MGWHYQARKKTYNGEVQFELVEAYPDLMEEGDTIIPHTNEAVTISADTKEDLAKWLRQAADDIEKYEVIDGDEGSGDIVISPGLYRRVDCDSILLDLDRAKSYLNQAKDGPSPQNSAKEKPLIDNLLDNFFEGWKV